MTLDNQYYADTRRILSWAEEDRPREKLLLKGKAALTDAELVAILIGSGTRDLSAVDFNADTTWAHVNLGSADAIITATLG